MSNEEKMLEQLKLSLKDKIEQFFESQERFDNKYILNSKITKDSTFEKNQFCSEWNFINISKLPLIKIILGDLDELELDVNLKVATSSTLPIKGSALNGWSSTLFGINIIANVTFNTNNKKFEVSKIEVRNR